MANQDRVNFVWAESALTTIPPIPVSEVAYRDTTQTPEQMEVGQQYDTIYNSARHNQLLFLLTSVAKTLCENGIMPFLAGQEYSQYARCIFTDGKLYTASRAILANEQPHPTPGDDSGVWIAEETSENLVPNSRRVIAGTGLTGGGPLSSDVTLSAKLDGKTTRADAGGVITVKDVAIGGDLGDLASARGQIGPARELGNNVDFNTVTEAGLYLINATGSANAPRENQAFFLQVIRSVKGAITKNLFQIAYNYSSVADLVFIRQYSMASSSWSVWTQLITSSQVGDGITVNNGIISVPEMQGATASKAGTSGLVPPATAGQQDSFLTGGGKYKPALTKISDSVNLADSKTAASAKAVKTAYDLANSKQANLGFTPVQQSGGAGQEGQKIYIGWSPSGLKAQAGVLDLGNIVTTSAGCMKAPSAANADYANTANGIGGHSWLDVIDTGGNPKWVVGLATDGSDKIKPILPASLRVEYANSAGSAPANGGTAWATTTVPNVATGDVNQAVPAGGTWTFIVSRDGAGNTGTIAGGTVISRGVWLAIRIA